MSTVKRNARGGQKATLGASLVRGWAVALLVGGALLLLLSALAYRSSDPRAGLSFYATLLLLTVALCAGFTSARTYRKSGVLTGILAGGGLGILFFGMSLALSSSGGLSTAHLLPMLLMPLLGALGGMLGSVKSRRRRRRPR